MARSGRVWKTARETWERLVELLLVKERQQTRHATARQIILQASVKRPVGEIRKGCPSDLWMKLITAPRFLGWPFIVSPWIRKLPIDMKITPC